MQKVCLGLMVFVCGWVLMAIEMIGPRIMSPIFGTDIYTWASVISVFLLALSLGYWIGGQASRRWNSPWTLTIVGLAVAVCIAIMWLTYRPINSYLEELGVGLPAESYVDTGEDVNFDEQSTPGISRWGPPLLYAVGFFFLPSVLLGMVSPLAIRLAARDLATVGASAGHLYALSTVGSFLGCLVTAFHLIPRCGTSAILVGYSVVMLVVPPLFGFLYARSSR